MSIFILLWVVQIGVGIAVYATNPKRNDVSDKAQRMRNMAIFGGLVPCVGFMLVYQLIALGMYRGALALADRSAKKYQGRLETSFGTPSRPAPVSNEPAEKPFGGPIGSGEAEKPRRDNPFA